MAQRTEEATTCTHERTTFPARPEPDAWYPCPDCGERVGRRGGRIITIGENNAQIARQRARGEALSSLTDDELRQLLIATGSSPLDGMTDEEIANIGGAAPGTYETMQSARRKIEEALG